MTPKITLFYYNNNNTFEAIVDLDKCPISQGIWYLYGYKKQLLDLFISSKEQ